MLLSKLRDKFLFYFNLEKAKRGVDISLSPHEVNDLLTEAYIAAVNDLGKIDLRNYIPNSSTPTKTVLLPPDYGMIDTVNYDGERLLSVFEHENGYKVIYSSVGANTGVFLVFSDNIVPNRLSINYYAIGIPLMQAVQMEMTNPQFLYQTYDITLSLPDNMAMLVIYSALAIIFPDAMPIYLKELSRKKGLLPKPDKIQGRFVGE